MDTQPIAFEIARHFLKHLIAEQAKAPELIDAVRFDGRTGRDINGELIDRLKKDFPGIAEAPPPDFNFIVRWAEMNDFHLKYEDFVFEAYNIIFYERILHIRDWSEEARKRFHDTTLHIFEKFDTDQEGFSVSFFVRVENNMRELLRDIMDAIPNIDHAEGWKVVFEQSKEYQEVVNEFFEHLLKDALDESERLLHNILPIPISAELKQKGRVEPVHLDEATVLFTDFKGFTFLSEKMSPGELIANLDECFSIFDGIIDRHGLEKIKTIGDAYMCVGGLPDANHTHAVDAALAALAMREAIARLKREHEARDEPYWDVRIGFHTGPLVAGVIGKKKFSYDVWGDTVNTASRMESSGEPGRVNMSGSSHETLKYLFDCEGRGRVKAKNKGEIEMFFLNGIKPRYSADGLTPNDEFLAIYEKIKGGARLKFASE